MPAPNPSVISIPDLISYCQFPLTVNPHCEVCSPATDEWISSCYGLSSKRLKTVAGVKAGTLASMAWPSADLPELRVCADFMHFLFHLDDLTDNMGVKDAKEVADVVMDILNSPDRYTEAVESGKAPAVVTLTYDLWKRRMLLRAGPNVQARFKKTLGLFFQAVNEQSTLRVASTTSDLESYILLRREDGAVKPSFVMIEYVAGTDLPEDVLEHPTIRRLENAANDFIVWSNDIYSFNKEQARGDLNNLVTIVMREKGLLLQEAIDFIGDLCKTQLDQFAEDRRNLPSWDEEIDRDVSTYVQGLADWVVGSLHWSFISHRYFFDKGPEIKRSHVLELLPPKRHAEV